MYKETRWAKELLALQEPDGKWGCFHSLSAAYGAPITTEQALNRLERLGFATRDDCIQKAVAYMHACLTGKLRVPDREEKLHDWPTFTSLLLAARIRRFTNDDAAANRVAAQWAAVITEAFSSGSYRREAYHSAYKETFGLKAKGGRLADHASFYPVSLLRDMLDPKTESAFLNDLLQREKGRYALQTAPIGSQIC